jgi:hypothetical protein
MGKLNFGVAIEISRLNATASSLATQSLFTAAYAKGCLRLIWHFQLSVHLQYEQRAYCVFCHHVVEIPVYYMQIVALISSNAAIYEFCDGHRDVIIIPSSQFASVSGASHCV